jgi:hypothetical protein
MGLSGPLSHHEYEEMVPMYSHDAISNRRRSHSEPTEEMVAGLVCVVCRTDYRRAPDAGTLVVAHHSGRQLLACEGVCTRMAGGAVNSTDELPLPLVERVHRYEAER